MIFSIIIFAVFCASAGGTGIVKSVAPNGPISDPRPDEDMLTVWGVKRYLTCGYEKESNNFPSQTHVYSIECRESEKSVIGGKEEEKDKKTLILRIKYRTENVDYFEVTSCKKEDIVESVFPSKDQAYPDDDYPIAFLKYKMEDDKCYVRKYVISECDDERGYCLERLDPQPINCEGTPGLPDIPQEWVQFTVCNTNPVEKLPPIVKSMAPNGEEYQEEYEELGSKHYLTCGYQHDSHTYSIECRESKKKSTKDENDQKALNLLLKYNGKEIDYFEVKSCQLKYVLKAVYPSKPNTADLEDNNPVIYSKYRNQDGKCYARKYKLSKKDGDNEIQVERLYGQRCICEGAAPGLPFFLEFADEFTNCRVAQKEVSYMVKKSASWSPDYPTWTDADQKRVKILECSWSWFVKPFHLTCVKGDKEGEYLAVVRYEELVLQIFNVKTCDEDAIANGIFPGRQLQKKEDGSDEYDLYFGAHDEKCYLRKYPQKEPRKLNEPEVINCPAYPDEWTNPISGKTGQWYECHKFEEPKK